ncbi:MAG: sel1 repeat family protein, partial [Neisseriaceae bacterium]|nr:sel1 repeat family protein [Neisseriaceae bacterium]
MSVEMKYLFRVSVVVLSLSLSACSVMQLEKMACAMGRTNSCTIVSSLYYEKQDYANAKIYAEKAAEQGDAQGQYNLAILYNEGQGVEQDYVQAKQWYEKAAEQGFAQAQNNLGTLYEKGNGVEQNYAKAFELYKKSAE